MFESHDIPGKGSRGHGEYWRQVYKAGTDLGKGSRGQTNRVGMDPSEGSRGQAYRAGTDPREGSKVKAYRVGTDPGEGSMGQAYRRGDYWSGTHTCIQAYREGMDRYSVVQMLGI